MVPEVLLSPALGADADDNDKSGFGLPNKEPEGFVLLVSSKVDFVEVIGWGLFLVDVLGIEANSPAYTGLVSSGFGAGVLSL